MSPCGPMEMPDLRMLSWSKWEESQMGAILKTKAMLSVLFEGSLQWDVITGLLSR